MQAHRKEQQDHHENMQTWETAEHEFQVEKGNVLGHIWLTTHLLHANSRKLQVVPDLGESDFCNSKMAEMCTRAGAGFPLLAQS